MTIYKSFKDAGDDLTGKILISKRAHTVWDSNKSSQFNTGDLFFIMSHDKTAGRSSNWTPYSACLTIIHNDVGCKIPITNTFGADWAIAEAIDLFKGAGVVFTGALSLTREYYQKLVELFGGDFQNSVTKKTAYLVMADKHSQSSKAVKARAMGVKLINEQEFLDLIRNHE